MECECGIHDSDDRFKITIVITSELFNAKENLFNSIVLVTVTTELFVFVIINYIYFGIGTGIRHHQVDLFEFFSQNKLQTFIQVITTRKLIDFKLLKWKIGIKRTNIINIDIRLVHFQKEKCTDSTQHHLRKVIQVNQVQKVNHQVKRRRRTHFHYLKTNSCKRFQTTFSHQ